MPQKVQFAKVSILGFSRKLESGTLKLSCLGFKSAQKSLEWPDLADGFQSGTVCEKLAASLVELMPAKTLDSKAHSIELKVSAVRDFEFLRVQVKKGKQANKQPQFRLELHFSVDFTDQTGAMKLEAGMQSADDWACRITYEKQAEQEEIPLTSTEQREAVSEANDTVQ